MAAFLPSSSEERRQFLSSSSPDSNRVGPLSGDTPCPILPRALAIPPAKARACPERLRLAFFPFFATEESKPTVCQADGLSARSPFSAQGLTLEIRHHPLPSPSYVWLDRAIGTDSLLPRPWDQKSAVALPIPLSRSASIQSSVPRGSGQRGGGGFRPLYAQTVLLPAPVPEPFDGGAPFFIFFPRPLDNSKYPPEVPLGQAPHRTFPEKSAWKCVFD